jgi:MoxR-like ATPase
MVIATQNPLEHHGTYPLPESQLDRFLLRLRIGYPAPDSERDIMRAPEHFTPGSIDALLGAAEIIELQNLVHKVRVDASLADYMLAIVRKTREHDALSLGVSPRGSQALYRACQALAMVEGRGYVIPDDVKRLAPVVCGHRVVVNARAALAPKHAELGHRIIEEILQHIDVPL